MARRARGGRRSAARPTHAPFTHDGGRKAARLFLACRELATAVVVSSDVQAIGVITVSCAGWVCGFPEGLALVSVDCTCAPA
jgi:DNA-binding LacI/PurR family transcriptional regulator